MLWALTIVVLPVPTALVSGSREGDKTEVLYIGTMALSSLALTVAAWRVAATPRIRDGGVPPNRVDSITTFAIMVLALVLSLLIPAAGYLPLLLLLASGRVSALIRSRRKGSVHATGDDGPLNPRSRGCPPDIRCCGTGPLRWSRTKGSSVHLRSCESPGLSLTGATSLWQ